MWALALALALALGNELKFVLSLFSLTIHVISQYYPPTPTKEEHQDPTPAVIAG